MPEVVTSTVSFEIADLNVGSSFVTSGGSVTSRTTGTGTRTVTISVPDDATMTGAVFHCHCGAGIGSARTLTVNGNNLATSADNVVDFSSTITGEGSYTLTFKFCDNGRGSLSDGTHYSTMHFTNMYMEVAYTQPDPEPSVDPDPPAGTEESVGLITLHDGSDRDFGAGLGVAVLTPTVCTVTETAGGDYSLQMEHPLTPDGRWKLIQPWMLVRVQVPMSDTPAIDGSGGITVGCDIWVVKNASAGLYETNKSTRYSAWVAGKTYNVGAYVRYQGRNYKCTVPNNYSIWVSGCWKDLGTGDPKAKLKLPQGTRLYVSTADSTWIKVRLATGETGYCKKADCEFVRTATQEDIDALKTSARSIRAQVFRLTEVTVTNDGVSATGMHVSYDYNLEVLAGFSAQGSDLPNAVLDLRSNILIASDIPSIYCEDTGINIDTEWSAGISPVEVLLNPDTGFVAQSKARLIRDNWDFFLLQNQGEDRGFRIAYGINMTGVTWKRDFSTVVTRVIPVGKYANGEPLYLGASLGAPNYVESEIADQYPMIAYKYLAVDAQVGQDDPDGNPYTEETARAEMQRQAEACFDDGHEDEPQVELDVSFVQLGDTDAYSQYRQLERVSLYDWVTIDHPDLGISTRAQVKGYEWDAIRRTFNKITLGDVFQVDTGALAGWQIADGSITPRKLSEAARAAIT